MKKIGQNSESRQKQNCYCESIKELIQNKKHKYSYNLKINWKSSFKENQFEKNWTQ